MNQKSFLPTSQPATSTPLLVKKIANLLFKLNKEKGITLIIVTHDHDLADKCDRQIHVKDGRVVSDSGRDIEASDGAEDYEDNNIDGMLDHNRPTKHININEEEE